MTSEICVMNRHSLVLAADSAATVSRWENGKKEERYFKGSNKIFQLSNSEPVGIMIYDSADLQRIPWEIIVKTFRSELASKSFQSVREYGLQFLSFIEQHRGLFPAAYLDELFIENVDQIMIRFLNMINEDDTVTSAAPDEGAVIEAKRVALENYLVITRTFPLVPPLTQEDFDAAKAKHLARLEVEAETNLNLFSNSAPLDKISLVELGLEALFRRPEIFLSQTGIVIAGYGTHDFFPSYVEFSCMGFVGGRLCAAEKGDHAITQRDSGFFKAFATTAMADTFTMGFGPDVFNLVRSHLRDVLRDFAGKLGANPQNLADLVDDAVSTHADKWTADVFERHGRPLRRVIGSLPTDELAELAETLVMLESLKEKVTSPSESVGGPIDVAIITKHEGFVWAKRKLYFDPKLNSRFFLRQQADHRRSVETANGPEQ
ncbi:hypothetical protein [Bradyrhizobium betae]|uniref:Uncharacterized protein n=1 Tax=Bradyrhizobium betae TaxID=244734 RepID=A0A5P6NYG9_9BRAD|nr:hypothetical protein [Bradyrhizobium betae]MCS3725539.1 hypothetical protein [Bradyrhizobium betae]QFI71177.1 hypothetical protein F8237_01590 [Bradyrhizobium betae]